MPNESRSQKRTVLKEASHRRLWGAVEKHYGEDPNVSQLNRDTSLDPKVIRKIRDRSDPKGNPRPVTLGSLVRFFGALREKFEDPGFEFEFEQDCENVSPSSEIAPEKPVTPEEPSTSEDTSLPESQIPQPSPTFQTPELYDFKKALQALNYRSQSRLYSDFFEESCLGEFAETYCSAGMVLVYGEPSSGQRWLVNRLIRASLPERMRNPNKIPVHLRGGDIDIQDLWGQLGDRLLGKRDVTPQDLVQSLYERLYDDHVVLVIHDCDRLPAADLPKLFVLFWLPLLGKLSASSEKPPYRAPIEYKRQSVLYGTVNHDLFLSDTENR